MIEISIDHMRKKSILGFQTLIIYLFFQANIILLLNISYNNRSVGKADPKMHTAREQR